MTFLFIRILDKMEDRLKPELQSERTNFKLLSLESSLQAEFYSMVIKISFMPGCDISLLILFKLKYCFGLKYSGGSEIVLDIFMVLLTGLPFLIPAEEI